MQNRWTFARLGIVGALIAGSLVFVFAPPAQSTEASLSAVNSSTWQTNGSVQGIAVAAGTAYACLLYTSPSPRDLSTSRMPSSA